MISLNSTDVRQLDSMTILVGAGSTITKDDAMDAMVLIRQSTKMNNAAHIINLRIE